MEASVGREKREDIWCQASELCWSETDMNSTLRAPSSSEAQLFGGICHQCVPISGVICWGHKCMLGELDDYREKAKCENRNILPGLICRDLNTRSTWETGRMACN